MREVENRMVVDSEWEPIGRSYRDEDPDVTDEEIEEARRNGTLWVHKVERKK